MADTMYALRLHEYGGPEVLRYEQVERPTPGAGEILVQNYATSINPVDWKTRNGYLAGALTLPFIPGWDVAGVIVQLGEGVTGFEVGQEVYGMIVVRGGTYAEYVVVKPAEIAPKPASLDWNATAAIPLVALTAWQALFDTGELKAGQRVLIHAAAGGVGNFAVQLAHNAGAYVVGTASPSNHAFVREFGADEVVDYHNNDFSQYAQSFDIVLDAISGETENKSWPLVKPGGKLISIVGQPSQEQAEKYGVQGVAFRAGDNAAELVEIARQLDSGQIRPYVTEVVPLSQATQALSENEQGHAKGKVAVRIR